MTLRSWSKSPSLPREECGRSSASPSDCVAASRQSVHAAGMSDRLPFGRMTSTSSTPRRLMLLITASDLAFERMALADDGYLIRDIAEMGSLSPLPSTRSARNG